MMVNYIDENREEFGVEPICDMLRFASSTYYAARSRLPSARQLEDAVLMPILLAIWTANFEVYGVRKMWKAMVRLVMASDGTRPPGSWPSWGFLPYFRIPSARLARRSSTLMPSISSAAPDEYAPVVLTWPLPATVSLPSPPVLEM
jgi:hypothetical protein